MCRGTFAGPTADHPCSSIQLDVSAGCCFACSVSLCLSRPWIVKESYRLCCRDEAVANPLLCAQVAPPTSAGSSNSAPASIRLILCASTLKASRRARAAAGDAAARLLLRQRPLQAPQALPLRLHRPPQVSSCPAVLPLTSPATALRRALALFSDSRVLIKQAKIPSLNTDMPRYLWCCVSRCCSCISRWEGYVCCKVTSDV